MSDCLDDRIISIQVDIGVNRHWKIEKCLCFVYDEKDATLELLVEDIGLSIN